MKVLLLVVLIVAQVLAGSVITSPLREREPFTAEQIESMVFGLTFDEIDLDQECHVEVDMQWMAVLGGVTLPNAPLIGDFRNDGSKEIVVAVGKEYVEVLEGENGDKEPGWPYYIPDRSFSATPIDHDLTGGSIRDIVVPTDNGEIIFLSEEGFPYHGATLKVPNLPVDKGWYKEYEKQNQTLYEPLWMDLPSKAERQEEWEVLYRQYEALYEEFRTTVQGNHKHLTDEEFQANYQKALADHVTEQASQVRKHMNVLSKNLANRRLLETFDDDDLEDERGTRMVKNHDKLTSIVHTFEGVQGWLTNDGVESLELFLPTEMSTSFISALRSTADVLFSPQLDNYKQVGRKKLEFGQIKISPRIVGSPIIVDLEGDGHNEMVVAVNYAPKRVEVSTTRSMYMANAIVAFDLLLHQVKWISPLELSAQDPVYKASFINGPTIVDLDGDGELNIIIGSSMGQIHVLDNYGIPIEGFPIAMGPIIAPVVVEDIDQDGKLDIIGMDGISNLAVFNRRGQPKWDIQLTPGCTSAPALADINDNGILDIVVSCNSGAVHVVDASGKEVKPFPILQEPGMRGSPTLLKMGNNEHFHVLSMAASGHLYITDAKNGCTEVVDIGLGAGLMAPMIVADDVTGNGKMDLVVTTGFRFMYCLSTETDYHPLNTWLSPNHKRNVYTSSYHQGIYITDDFRAHRDITGDSFILEFEIVDNRLNKENAYYDVEIKLRRDLDPIFQGRFSFAGVKTIPLVAPTDRLSATLRIEMTNEHQQFFSDSISLTFNMKFYKSIKWVIIIPFTICAIFVYYLKQEFTEMVI